MLQNCNRGRQVRNNLYLYIVSRFPGGRRVREGGGGAVSLACAGNNNTGENSHALILYNLNLTLLFD